MPLPDDIKDVVRLQELRVLSGLNRLKIRFKDSDLIFRIDGPEQQCVENMLGTHILQCILRDVSDLVVPHYELIFWWYPELEFAAVAHHVECLVTDNRHQADHAQHRRLAR